MDDDRERIDWERVHGWLTSAYWSRGISRDAVERAARHSTLIIGAYRDSIQVGYLRVVSDCTRIAYLCDVWVDESARGRGLGRAIVRHAMNHPELAGVRWLLATADAHGVYTSLGFGPLTEPERWMATPPWGEVEPTSPRSQ